MISPSETSFASEVINTTTQKNFIVTAYYSPLPGQADYFRWSYEADVRLNGNGTHGASGTPVFTGMIAAPKTYAFGTQIFFEGLWLGTVSDRGGAIVEAYVRGQAYDRIDLWVGYGDEWLKRARAWGRREVKGTMVQNDTRDPINIAGITNGSVNLNQYPPVNGFPSIGWLPSDTIAAFADLGYNFKWTDTKSMIVEFQIEQKIIQSKDDEAAGTYGPRTRAALAALHTEYLTKHDAELAEIDSARKLLLTDHETWQKQYQKAETTVSSFGQPKLQEINDGIKKLQSFLSEKKYYTGNPDGKMTTKTLVAIRKYQKARNIKTTGKLDDITRSAMIDDMASSL